MTTTNIDLTDTQRAILAAACARPDGAVFPVTTGLKGGALQKVLGALEKRGLIVGDAGTWFATSAAYAVLGVDRPVTPSDENEAATEPAVANAAPPRQEQAAPDAATILQGDVAHRQPTIRAGTKQALLIDLLRRPEGATIEEITTETGWLPHTVRGAIAGALKKRLGMTVTSEKVEGGRGRVYRIAG